MRKQIYNMIANRNPIYYKQTISAFGKIHAVFAPILTRQNLFVVDRMTFILFCEFL